MLTFIWNATIDARSCNKCKALHGFSWVFRDEIPNFLDHPHFGPVWDLLMDKSMAHGFQEFNCRCEVIITINDSDMNGLFKDVITDKHGLEGTIEDVLISIRTFRGLM